MQAAANFITLIFMHEIVSGQTSVEHPQAGQLNEKVKDLFTGGS